VFERFYRTPQSVSDGIKGSGLGLYFCHRIVEEHVGRIWIGSASHGATGTSVHVAIPRTLPDDEAALSHQF
jgi:signal transduction histidine kinase